MPKVRTKTKVKSSYTGSDGKISTAVKTGSRIATERDEALLKRSQQLQAFPSDVRRAIDREVQNNGAPPDDLTGVPMEVEDPYGNPDWVDDDDEDNELPEISHEGGELEDRLRVAFELTNAAYGKQRFRRPWDLRTRRERIRALHRNWEAEMPFLVEEYLRWKHARPDQAGQSTAMGGNAGGATDGGGAEEETAAGLRTEGVGADGGVEAEVRVETGAQHHFHVCGVRTFKRTPDMAVAQQDNESANVSLLRMGFLGCAPLQPSVAFDLRTLELYHRLRRRHSGLGLLPMARALCDLHDVDYRSSFREQLSIAFDAYLEILRRTKQQVDAALGRSDPLWRLKNSCPPCSFKLKDEPPLVPSRLGCIDGNNSAKRVASAGAQDLRNFESPYFLTREQVDRYKDEVRGKRVLEALGQDDAVEDAPWAPDPDSPGDPTDGQDGVTPCTERWKASAAEHTKRALDVYDITGIFGGSCRHGLITLFCEMVRSGELAKYPLAITDHTLDAHDEEDEGLAFDIGCAFEGTVQRSPLVGPNAFKRRLQVFVNAFHGWAHNRLCQLSHHPLYRTGVGLEDLEGMERVFSASNAVARVVRYSSRFHWMQALDLHFQQWDEDKYANLSRFLLNNYRQAISIILDYTHDVDDMLMRLNITEDVVQQWLQEEEKFLRDLKDEPEDRLLECAYVEALIAQEKADKKWDATSQIFVSTPLTQGAEGSRAYSADRRKTARLEAARRAALTQLSIANRAVEDLEAKLEVDSRWTLQDVKYQEVLEYLQKREFHKALNKVQQLVVQRLFEMSKANIAGMGYKVRTSIWKHLKTRGKAIRTALTSYNNIASKMKPPAPVLEWKSVVNFSFVAEFDILRHSHADIDFAAKPWMSPANREVVNKLFKILRAREEITRLNVEVTRLRTFLFSEDTTYLDAITVQQQAGKHLLASEIEAQYKSRFRVNKVHHTVLNTIEGLPGFTGTQGGGFPASGLADGAWEDADESGDAEVEAGLEDADLQEQCFRMTEVMEDLAMEGDL